MLVVDLVAVAVPLRDLRHFVGKSGLGRRHQVAAIRPEAHGPPQVGDGALVGQQVDHRVRRVRVELPAVGTGQTAEVACELDHCALHPQTDTKEGNQFLPGIGDGGDLPFDPSPTEATRHQHAGHVVEVLLGAIPLDLLRIHGLDGHKAVVGDAAVRDGLEQALVGVAQLHILPHHRDGDPSGGTPLRGHDPLPGRQVLVPLRQAEHLHHQSVQSLPVEREGDFVDGAHVPRRDDRLLRHVAEEGDLLFHLLGQVAIGAAQQDVRLDPDLQQLLDRVLGRLGLQLAGGADVRHQREMHIQGVLAPHIHLELADRLQKRQALDVAHRAAHLHDDDVDLLRHPEDAPLDLIRDVRDDLDGPSQVVAPTLFGDHGKVDLARGDVVVLGQPRLGEPLVVAQVQVRLRPVIGDEDLAVLEGAHGAGVHVDVRIALEQRDLESPALQQAAEGGGGQPLPQGGHHAAGHEDELGRHNTSRSHAEFGM